MPGEWYKMDFDAWDEGTDDLTLEQEAAYLRLCHQLYRRKAAIPNSPASLARIWRCHQNKARKLISDLVAAGKVSLVDGFLSNTRVTRELDDRETRRRQQVDAGHTGGARSQEIRRKPLQTNDGDQADAQAKIKRIQAERERERELEEEKKDKTPQDPNGSSAPKGARARGCRIPEDFVSSEEALAVCSDMGLHGAEAADALAEFRDFWVGVPGGKGTKLDWPATLRNRLREVGRRQPQARASPKAAGRSNPYHEVVYEALERAHGTGSDDSGFRPRFIAGSRH